MDGGTAAPDAPRTFKTAAVSRCTLPEGGDVGAGCWMPTGDCVAAAREHLQVREQLARDAKAPRPEHAGFSAQTVMVVGLLALMAGAAGGLMLGR